MVTLLGNSRPSRSISHRRVAVIGAGHVGATAAYALMLRALFREIVLVDSDVARSKAEARDIADANALARPVRIWAGDYVDAADASVAVITAGAATHGTETRLSVASRSAAIVRECVTDLSRAGFNGIVLIASNPVDAMSLVAFDCAGLSANRVFGTGTLLDTSRLKTQLASLLEVSADAIDATIIGEHGDSEVPVFSGIRIGGLTLAEFSETSQTLDRPELARVVREAAYDIIAGKGHTSFGVATAIVRICEAIVRDEKVVLPVAAQMAGAFGVSHLYLSLPCIIGSDGIERVLVPALTDEEQKAFCRSAQTVREVCNGISKGEQSSSQDLPASRCSQAKGPG